MTRLLSGVLVLATSAVLANPARALEVWLTVGEHGEPSFSDAAPDAGDGRVVEVREVPSVDDAAALERSERLTQSLLESAAALEESRLRREAMRAERRAAQPPQPAPEERYDDEDERYVVGWPWYGPRWPHRPLPPHVSHHGPPRPGAWPPRPDTPVVAPEPRPMAVRWRSP